MEGISDAIGGNQMMGQMAKQMVLGSFGNYIGRIEPKDYTNKIFNPESRAYFNVDTDTVKNKLLKLLLPFKTFEFEDQIKKLDLYLPIVSFMTLIMFSTLLEGITTEKFTPRIGKQVIWISFFTIVEVLVAKFTENAVSSLNLGVIELLSLVSYRFVPLSAVVFLMVITSASVPFLGLLGAIYALAADTYYCVLLSNCCRERSKQEGMGNRIALVTHAATTALIIWLSNIL